MSAQMKKNSNQMKCFSAKGREASQLRQRKYALVRQYGLPENLLGGSLHLGHRRCGKPGCHCQTEQGHPQWRFTFSVEGIKNTEPLPIAWAEQVRPLVEDGQAYLNAVRELAGLNAQLLGLYRQQEKDRRRRPIGGGRTSGARKRSKNVRRRTTRAK